MPKSKTILRKLDLLKHLAQKSCFLFGARGTGKSFWARHQLENRFEINLLRGDQRLRLGSNPSDIQDIYRENQDKVIFIDEIQKLPDLLDEVHDIIESSSRQARFLLTGSSSRKLRQSGSNMLGGRARTLSLFPLTTAELGEDFDIIRYGNIGSLPSIYFSENPRWELTDYIDTYLKDEIRDECKVRNLEGFERFLVSAAANSGQMINYSKIANDTQVSANSVKAYYDILEETLLAYKVPAWKSPIRKAVQTEKIYLFDIGVRFKLMGIDDVKPKTEQWGEVIEHLLVHEIKSYLAYNFRDEKLTYWRDMHQHEVDLVIGNKVAIEVKGKYRVHKSDLGNLKLLKQEQSWTNLFLVSCDPIARQTEEGIRLLPWQDFLNKLWNHQILI